jgi:four helix bundle protein
MNKEELKSRTKALALRVMAMIDHLPNTTKGRVIADQIMRSATSVASNYRAACRGRSRAEFISKLGVALEEVDETMLWLELIGEGQLLRAQRVSGLIKEVDELTAIMFSAQRSARQKVLIPKS